MSTMWSVLLGLMLNQTAAGEVPVTAAVEVVLVIGAPGAEEYGKRFDEWAGHWELAALQAKANITVIGRAPVGTLLDRELLELAIQERATGAAELWLVLIGHGTFDRRDAKFNLRGPDVSAPELKTWLANVTRPTAVIDLSAASGPFLTALAAPGRIVITATKSGGEQNFPVFGGHLSQGLLEPLADLDKDRQVSLWEAYLYAGRRTAEFYQGEGRLQTEHALLDDNGDGQGTRAEAFDGLEPIQTSADGRSLLDGERAHRWHLVRTIDGHPLSAQTRRVMDQLETEIAALKRRKGSLPEAEYYDRLETLLVALARATKPAESPAP
jgi:hypothetical protein